MLQSLILSGTSLIKSSEVPRLTFHVQSVFLFLAPPVDGSITSFVAFVFHLAIHWHAAYRQRPVQRSINQ